MSEFSKKEQELMLRRRARALELRNDFQKQITNPFRHATGEGGAVFDAVLYRFQAMRVNHFDHFRPTLRTVRIGLFTIALPMILYGWLLKSDRDSREKQYRNGEVAYKDRRFKFI